MGAAWLMNRAADVGRGLVNPLTTKHHHVRREAGLNVTSSDFDHLDDTPWQSLDQDGNLKKRFFLSGRL
jgi:hypothetical protein